MKQNAKLSTFKAFLSFPGFSSAPLGNGVWDKVYRFQLWVNTGIELGPAVTSWIEIDCRWCMPSYSWENLVPLEMCDGNMW